MAHILQWWGSRWNCRTAEGQQGYFPYTVYDDIVSLSEKDKMQEINKNKQKKNQWYKASCLDMFRWGDKNPDINHCIRAAGPRFGLIDGSPWLKNRELLVHSLWNHDTLINIYLPVMRTNLPNLPSKIRNGMELKWSSTMKFHSKPQSLPVSAIKHFLPTSLHKSM